MELKRGVACGYNCMQMATGVMGSVFFTFLIDKISNKSTLRKQEFPSAHVLKVWSIMLARA